ncbi:CLUMA_CG007764, isoform A [Clunio marinus]|uniref:CLUMA_CG007764, isoform A n=1 Tax=Clunio marinus TaxID=568069 RepID=A0A1J1I753_9DIPT|nr:CLUMA_CG007764, isoform A [Clunio marinus]
MAKIIFFTFFALCAFALCSANSVGSPNDEIPMEETEMEALYEVCAQKGVPWIIKNAACDTWCWKVQNKRGGYCDNKTYICTCHRSNDFADNVESAYDEIPKEDDSEIDGLYEVCSQKGLPWFIKNASCDTFCWKVLNRRGGKCNPNTLICECN